MSISFHMTMFMFSKQFRSSREKRTFQRDVGLPHLDDLFPSLFHTRITPSAQLESECPSRLPLRFTDQFTVLFDDFLRRRSREEIEIKGSSYESILNEGFLSRIRG